MLMISLISTGIIFIDRAYYVREQEENYRCQAKFYAESAIELVQTDICKEGTGDPAYQSMYVSAENSTKTFYLTFPDAENWTCSVTVNHSVVLTANNDSPTPEEVKKARESGEIYLTAKVTRGTTNGGTKELSEVCAKMKYNDAEGSKGWEFVGYYNL